MNYLIWWLLTTVCHFSSALPNTHTHLPPFFGGQGGGGPPQPPVAAALQGEPGLGNPQQNFPPQGSGNPQVLPPQYRDQGPGNPQIILPPQQQGQVGQVILPGQQQPPTDNDQNRDQLSVDEQNRQQQQRRHQQPGIQVPGAQPYASQQNPQRLPSGVPNIIINPAPSPPPPITGALVVSSKRRVQKTDVQCLKTHMQVTFRFSAPFNGYIYPHNQFGKCLLFRGDNALEAVLSLRHGTCGDQENRITYRGKTFLDPVIEHRLMVQWEREIVSEDDSSVIVRCDRPDDYNKTVEWKLGTQELSATLERAQHPGENHASAVIPAFVYGYGNLSSAYNESGVGLRGDKLNDYKYSIGNLSVKVEGKEEEKFNFTIPFNETNNEKYEERNAVVTVNDTKLKISTLTISTGDIVYEIQNYTALIFNFTLKIKSLNVALNDSHFLHNEASIVNDSISKIENLTLAVDVAELEIGSIVSAANSTELKIGN